MTKSTSRTYAKRVIREIVSKNFLSLISVPIHLAIMAKTNLQEVMKEQNFKIIEQELTDLLKQIDFDRIKS